MEFKARIQLTEPMVEKPEIKAIEKQAQTDSAYMVKAKALLAQAVQLLSSIDSIPEDSDTIKNAESFLKEVEI